MNGISDWLSKLPETLIPPFCMELVLRDGSRHYIAQGSDQEAEDEDTLVLRIWDLRDYDPDELEELRQSLSDVRSPAEVVEWAQSQPKLDWGSLRIPRKMVAYCIEWHDRIWPLDERPQIGFAPNTE